MEKLMFQKSLILKKIQLLQNELTLIDYEMEFERKFSSKQKVTVEPTVEKPKSIASPEQTTTEYKALLELISGSEGLRPLFSTVLTKEKYSKIILGTIPRKFQDTTQGILEDMEDYNLDATYTEFLIFWDDQEEPIQTYKYVQIGVCKDKIYAPSQAKDILLEKKDLQELAEQKLLTLINKVFDIRKEDKLKVNLATHYCLMTSFSTSSILEIDYEKIREFQKQLVSPHVFGSHYPSLC
ncbi:hypothetical protein L6452_42305 [Arctium lappa]|uniref:Uncharacterized protein n=1 Tax=Arctium lappa TaxID=4217 RepID=A0ACB8XHU7_ARCLA|nr:hypothetical protein L6452_42305 [Arctium lappa]